MPTIPAGTSSQRYCIVVAMNAPLPSPSTITVRGRRQHSEARAAPTQATTPAVSAASLMMFLLRFGRERPVLERQPVLLAAASDSVSGLRILGQRDDLVARGTTDPIGKRRRPLTAVLPDAQGLPRAVEAFHQIARTRSQGQLDGRTAIRATNDRHQRIPKS